MTAHKAKTITVSKVIDAAWRNLLEQNVPPETHPDLVKTFKRFFYAGAKTSLDSLVYSDVLDEDHPDTATPEDINRIDAMMHEVQAFFVEVASGRQ
jgi:hypothetical protein